MADLTFPRMADEKWSHHEMPPVSALSPSGLLLAYAAGRETSAPSASVDVDTPQGPDRDSPNSNNAAADSTESPCHIIAIAKEIIAVDGIEPPPETAVDQSSQESAQRPLLQCNKEDGLTFVQVSAAITALEWLDDSHLACGLQDGTVVVISRLSGTNLGLSSADGDDPGDRKEWTKTISRRFHHLQHQQLQHKGGGGHGRRDHPEGVVRIRVSGARFSSPGGLRTGAGKRGTELTLWVLYEDRVVVCVGVDPIISLARKQLEQKIGSTTTGMSTIPAGDNPAPVYENEHQVSTPGPSFAKLQLEGQAQVLDVVACSAPPGLFELRSERHAHVILAAGVSPALAFYPIGPEARSFGLASIAWAVASRVTSLTVGAIGGIFGLVGLRGRGIKAAEKVAEKTAKAVKAAARAHGAGGGGGGVNEDGEDGEESPDPLVLRWDGGLQDGFRRVTHLCLDPSGRLAAAADGFGRVMLVDCETRQILRMWKGVRDAECGWLEVMEYWEGRRVASVGREKLAAAATPPQGKAVPSPVIGLYLAILAPLRGRVELWRMRHGPCVKLIPARTGARLVTCRPEFGGGSPLTRCYLQSDARGAVGDGTRLRLGQLSLEEGDLAELPIRLSRQPTVDDNYRLRKFEMLLGGSTMKEAQSVSESIWLSNGQEAREDNLYQLLVELEAVESLARALALLGGSDGGAMAPLVEGGSSSTLKTGPGTHTATTTLSASFQRRLSVLCHKRAEQAAVGEDETDTRKASTEASRGESSWRRKAAAVSVLRFRVAVFELYDLLESVELQPAGVRGEGADGDTAFLPPGRRGWRHALLCEEAAGWAGMVREGAGGQGLPCAQLPDFQEFLNTASAVLEVQQTQQAQPEDASSSGLPAPTATRKVSVLPLLRLKTDRAVRRASEVHLSAKSRGIGRESAAPLSSPFSGDPPDPDAAAEYAFCRERLVGWIFRPLLSDAFAMASLTQALSLLGLGGKGQVGTLIGDLAEWFLALPVGRAADVTVGREAQNCPVLRWLKGVILQATSSPRSSDFKSPEAWPRKHAVLSGERENNAIVSGKVMELPRERDVSRGRMKDLLDESLEGVVVASGREDVGVKGSLSTVDGFRPEEQEEGDDLHPNAEEILRPMYEACAASSRLENASMLSVVAAEALTTCRERVEESSLGELAIGGDEAWLTLARRLRLCLFVDRRLHWRGQPDKRDRATVRCFQEGKASVYALMAKDELLSFRDPSFAACSARETAEVEWSARSQREAIELKAKGKAVSGRRPGGDGGDDGQPVAAAPSLADARMDEYWNMVQRVAARAVPSRGASDPATVVVRTFESNLSSSTAWTESGRAQTMPAKGDERDDPDASSPTMLFFMRSHAQPIVLACHRTRWLVLSWAASDGLALAGEEAAVRRLSMAVDHLSHLRTGNPFLAACLANWLWEHGGVRSRVGALAGATSRRVWREDATEEGDADTLDVRPAREAFLAAAEEFLRLDALFSRGQARDGRGKRSPGDRGAPSNVSFMSLLTVEALRRCPWPGAWDRWVEECLRDAQVRPPLQSAVAAHLTLLRVLRVSTVCGFPEGEALTLFERGRNLCGPSSLHDELPRPPSTQTQSSSTGGVEGGPVGDSAGERGGSYTSRREAYIRRALEAIVPRPAQNVYRLARDFGLSEDTVRGWHCLILLRRGHDVLGEEAMSQVFSLQNLAGDILTILRLRLKRFLSFLETSPRISGGVLASLDADTCQWVRSVRDSEAVEKVGKGVRNGEKAGERPLKSTHGVLLCLARALPPESRHKRQANALVTMVDTILRSFASA